MGRSLRSIAFYCAVLACLIAFLAPISQAGESDAGNYPLSGKVLASSAKGAHSYQVATDNRVYLLLCEKVKGLRMRMPECKIDDRPIAVGDTVQFRVDGDWVYMPAAKGGEEGLRILTMEFKTIPPPAAGESGMVIGTGMHIYGQKQVAWSTTPTFFNRPAYGGGAPSMAPVMAIPVTGGPPVMMMPTAPSGGAFVTGIPMTGGPPVMGTRVGGPAMGGGGPPPWVHLLRVRVGENFYQLECTAKPCEIDKKPIELGDILVVRAEKKWAYVASGSAIGGKEQKFRILSETEDDAAPEAKDTAPDSKPESK